MPDKTGANPVTREDMKLIIKKLQPIKSAGYGELLIQVKEGHIVYTKQSIGEQVRMDLKTDE